VALAGVGVVDHRIPLAVAGGRPVGAHRLARVAVATGRREAGGLHLLWAVGVRDDPVCLLDQAVQADLVVLVAGRWP
jgi:hypothetical protein